ncbi:hypothetical protein HAX54_013438 [Datura stramonium]|uniref:C3H1-type domain-containing protein n=1 Tax=Datura stramonium TaxID=4076 RepID=A0ABS8RYC7_DATST|nr:hypothetical protein [Datura stramonium]
MKRQRGKEGGARGSAALSERGECNRGAACKFSHDEKRAANTGWGAEEDRSSRWSHDRLRILGRIGDLANGLDITA